MIPVFFHQRNLGLSLLILVDSSSVMTLFFSLCHIAAVQSCAVSITDGSCLTLSFSTLCDIVVFLLLPAFLY